ncbi:MAG: hypothetical protein EA397_07280 [Deltaproteobacteria bacterium]|nr:MAG: hypothetical protein EA397_07280 [Deltaproteobacteria bacterium]
MDVQGVQERRGRRSSCSFQKTWLRSASIGLIAASACPLRSQLGELAAWGFLGSLIGARRV